MIGSENSIGDVTGDATVVQIGAVHGEITIAPQKRLHIPRQLAPVPRNFTDRDVEHGHLETLRAECSADSGPTVIVLRGLPGVGKTELAMKWLNEISSEYEHGQLHLTLGGPGPAGAVSPASLLEQLLLALGVDSRNIPHSSAAQQGMFRSETFERSLILLLDDAANAGQVLTVLPASAKALVVVTCAQRIPELVAEGATIVDVEPMRSKAVVEYLTTALPPNTVAAAPDGAVERLAERCHGLPQLAHMAVRTLSSDPFETITGLIERFDEAMAAASRRDEAMGGRSVRSEIDAFLQTLEPSAVHLYRLLGLHPGAEFDIWAAAAVTGEAVERTRATLAELWRHGLLDDLRDGSGRYRLPEIVRQHAQEQAESSFGPQEKAEAHRCYSSYYLAGTIEAAGKGTRRWLTTQQSQDPPALPSLETVEAAWSWMRVNLQVILATARRRQREGDHEMVCQLAEAADGYLRERGRYTDRLVLIQMGITSAEASGNREIEARLRNQHGLALLELGRGDQARWEFSRSLRLARAQGDGRAQGAALECLGIASQRAEQDEEALTFFDQAEPFKAAMARPQAMAVLSLLRGRSLVNLGRYEDALEDLTLALEVFREPDDSGITDEVNTAKVFLEQGRAQEGLGRTEAAAGDLERALRIFTERGPLRQRARVHEVMAHTERTGDRQGRTGHLKEAVRLYRRSGGESEALRLERLLAGD